MNHSISEFEFRNKANFVSGPSAWCAVLTAEDSLWAFTTRYGPGDVEARAAGLDGAVPPRHDMRSMEMKRTGRNAIFGKRSGWIEFCKIALRRGCAVCAACDCALHGRRFRGREGGNLAPEGPAVCNSLPHGFFFS